MGAIIVIPEKLAEEARARGFDLGELALSALSEKLGLDPGEEALLRVELAERYLREGSELAGKDPVQASERLYKAAEEAVKALALLRGLEEASEAKRRGRWTATLLLDAAEGLAEGLKPEVRDWWTHAWYLHVEGFHEAQLKLEHVKVRVKYVELLVQLAKQVAERSGDSKAT